MSDVFISYVTDDEWLKRELAEQLAKEGISTADAMLNLGDNLLHRVEQGLREAEFGVLILSRGFLRRPWPRQELEELAMLDRNFGPQTQLLPVWHGVDQQYIARYSSALASRLGIDSGEGVEKMAEAIAGVVRRAREELSMSPRKSSMMQQKMRQTSSEQFNMPLTPESDLSRLRDVLVDHFNMAELHDLCLDLGIDFEDLVGSTKTTKVIELISYMQRRGRLDDLMRLVQTKRPHLM